MTPREAYPVASSPPRALLVVGLAALIALAGWSLFQLVSATIATSARSVSIRGVRLGLTPAQVRDRFVPGVDGSFRTITDGEDHILVWSPSAPSGDLSGARFEFHLGLLVAVRLGLAEGAPEADGAAVEIAEAAVVQRVPTSRDDAATQLHWLSRSCPTHAEEVARIVAMAESP